MARASSFPATSKASSPPPSRKENMKFLIQMSGAPGSGKSTLAKTLARRMRERFGLGAVVINHDLVKDFFLDPGVGGILSETRGTSTAAGILDSRSANTTAASCHSERVDTADADERGRGGGGSWESGQRSRSGGGLVSFTNAAKLSYKLDWVLVWDMFDQGHDVVILDSVCNYREVIENGLTLVRRWNSTCTAGDAAAAIENKTTGGTWDDGEEKRGGECGMAYVYVECRFGNAVDVDVDWGALDQRLKERAGRKGGALRSQRVGVFEGPVGDLGVDNDLSADEDKKNREEMAKELFGKWMNPVRPKESDGAIVAVFDSRAMPAEEGVGVVLEKLGLLGLS